MNKLEKQRRHLARKNRQQKNRNRRLNKDHKRIITPEPEEEIPKENNKGWNRLLFPPAPSIFLGMTTFRKKKHEDFHNKI